eukprot:gb/GECG01011203.1/.p1 GENE.gb/GECG01011203.1/~~gb/GECG01011203.1/.p1  ORF type:complete len:105 (+),score=0.43 gb/GECG01011203.1/:1-315(+)
MCDRNMTLRRIEFAGNHISDIGARYLADALSANTTLVFITWKRIQSGTNLLGIEFTILYSRETSKPAARVYVLTRRDRHVRTAHLSETRVPNLWHTPGHVGWCA